MSVRTLNRRAIRHARVRARLTGTAERPRLSVFRSNRYLYAQLVDDERGVTLAAADSRSVKGDARQVGEALAKAAQTKKIKTVVFDRGGYRYQGKIKDLALGARAGGLKF